MLIATMIYKMLTMNTGLSQSNKNHIKVNKLFGLIIAEENQYYDHEMRMMNMIDMTEIRNLVL